MGSATVRQQALDEIRNLPPDDPEAPALRRFVVGLRHTLGRATGISVEQREEVMTTAWAEFERYEKELFDKGFDQGVDKGIGKGRVQSILRVLQARGLTVTDEVRQRVLSCPAPTQLDLWTD